MRRDVLAICPRTKWTPLTYLTGSNTEGKRTRTQNNWTWAWLRMRSQMATINGTSRQSQCKTIGETSNSPYRRKCIFPRRLNFLMIFPAIFLASQSLTLQRRARQLNGRSVFQREFDQESDNKIRRCDIDTAKLPCDFVLALKTKVNERLRDV